jgi:catechol 2,3-dioxygenase
MKTHYLGHIVFYVRNLEVSLNFYERLLGLKRCIKVDLPFRAVPLSSGRTHHEVLLIEVGDAPGPLKGHRLGLYHVAFKVGDSLEELRQVKSELEADQVPIIGMSDHTVSQSIYVEDPDGNEVELYVDADPEIWREDPTSILAPVKPLRL